MPYINNNQVPLFDVINNYFSTVAVVLNIIVVTMELGS